MEGEHFRVEVPHSWARPRQAAFSKHLSEGGGVGVTTTAEVAVLPLVPVSPDLSAIMGYLLRRG